MLSNYLVDSHKFHKQGPTYLRRIACHLIYEDLFVVAGPPVTKLRSEVDGLID